MAQEVYNDVKPLSKKLAVAPLKDGEVAVFRLTKAFQRDISREEPSCPEVVQLAGVQKISDPGEQGAMKSKKMAAGIKEYKQIGTSGQVKPVFEPLIFVRGEMRITSKDQEKYVFAMRNLNNTSNRFRKIMGATNKNETNSFYLLGTKEVTNLMKISDMKYYAEKMVREASFQVLKELAVVLNANPDPRFKVKSYIDGATLDTERLKYELIQLAQLYPKQVISASPSDADKLKVQIYDALVYNILTFEKNSYFVSGDDDLIEILQPESDMDKVDSLIKFFMSPEGKKNYAIFAKALKKALQVN